MKGLIAEIALETALEATDPGLAYIIMSGLQWHLLGCRFALMVFMRPVFIKPMHRSVVTSDRKSGPLSKAGNKARVASRLTGYRRQT